MKVDLLKALESGPPLLMDGAMGTELIRAGVAGDRAECSAAWNLTHPEQVLAIHQAYAGAGAVVHLTNTFLANPPALRVLELEDQLEAINEAGVRLARQAAGAGGFVLGDIGPILDHHGVEFARPEELARVLASLGEADGFLLETCSSPRALEAVCFAFHRVLEADGKPILLSLTYHRDSRGRLVTLSGHGPETYARHAARHGVAALGMNCGKDIGTAQTMEVIRRYRDQTDLPLFARPNAGSPVRVGRELVYPHGLEEMAAALPELLAAGVRMVGGCCGTTPAHLAALAQALRCL
jgi:methionine synthase I (cobalamin-dependent)